MKTHRWFASLCGRCRDVFAFFFGARIPSLSCSLRGQCGLVLLTKRWAIDVGRLSFGWGTDVEAIAEVVYRIISGKRERRIAIKRRATRHVHILYAAGNGAQLLCHDYSSLLRLVELFSAPKCLVQ